MKKQMKPNEPYTHHLFVNTVLTYFLGASRPTRTLHVEERVGYNITFIIASFQLCIHSTRHNFKTHITHSSSDSYTLFALSVSLPAIKRYRKIVRLHKYTIDVSRIDCHFLTHTLKFLLSLLARGGGFASSVFFCRIGEICE